MILLSKPLVASFKAHFKAIDPLDNKYRFRVFIKGIDVMVKVSPLLLVWILFENYSTLRVMVIVYYPFFIFIGMAVIGESRDKSLSVKSQVFRKMLKCGKLIIEGFYFVSVLPLSSSQVDKYQRSTVHLALFHGVLTCVNLMLLLGYSEYLTKGAAIATSSISLNPPAP